MGIAFMWGAIAGGAVVIGALIGLFIPLKQRLIGYVMSFGTGILIGAATFELLDEALNKSTTMVVGVSFIVGSLVFTGFDMFVSSRGASKRKRSSGGNEGTGTAIFFGTILDAIPESIMIGASLLSGNVSAALVAAIFVSNIPEGLSSTTGLQKDGFSKKKILFNVGNRLVDFCTCLPCRLFDFSGITGYAVCDDRCLCKRRHHCHARLDDDAGSP